MSTTTSHHDEQHFPIMGSAGHLVVVGGPEGLVRTGIDQLDRLESLWSRFRPSSEISRLNQAGGSPCLVSGPTRLLVEAMLSAWELTGGRFDPTVGHALEELGYDHSWPLLSPPIRLPHAKPSVGPRWRSRSTSTRASSSSPAASPSIPVASARGWPRTSSPPS